MAATGIPFVKMEGIGNDYVYIDARKTAPKGLARLAVAMSDRHYGVGSDGLILIRASKLKGVKHRMQMFNSDGSESEMCGNGLRCVGKYLYDRNLERKEEFPIETGAGVRVRETFDAEDQNPVEMQRQGWQVILDNFARHVTARRG